MAIFVRIEIIKPLNHSTVNMTEKQRKKEYNLKEFTSKIDQCKRRKRVEIKGIDC